MRTEPRWIVTGALIAFLAGVCSAQTAEPPKAPPDETPKPAAIESADDEVPLEKLPTTESKESTSTRKTGRFYAEAGVWFAQPSGLEYHPAIAYPGGSEALVIDMPFKMETPPRWRLGWEIPNGLGEIIGTYFGYSQDQKMTQTAPGQYVYGEIEAFPLYAGVFDNGFADGFSAQAQTTLREIRFDFAREILDSEHVHAKWFGGLRLLSQKWNLQTQYYSIVQPADQFPPVIPPLGNRPDLAPLPDLARSLSAYDGRGLEGGVDFNFPFDHGRKFSLETGFSVAALRGKLHTDTFAQNHFYRLTFEGVDYLLSAPFDIFGQLLQPSDPDSDPVHAIDYISQVNAQIGLTSNSTSKSAFALDAYLGFRWKVWRDLDVFAGYRGQFYDGAGEIVRLSSATVLPSGTLNVQSLSRTPISTTYDGFYLGVGFLF